MMQDLDGDGRQDRLYSTMVGNQCGIAWKRNVTVAGGPLAFENKDPIPLPTLRWRNSTGPTDLGSPDSYPLYGIEYCSLNHQRTLRNVPDPDPQAGAKMGAIRPYRWLDADTDSRLYLLAAIYVNPDTHYDEAFGEEPPFGPWPACGNPEILYACASIEAACMAGNYGCDQTK